MAKSEEKKTGPKSHRNRVGSDFTLGMRGQAIQNVAQATSDAEVIARAAPPGDATRPDVRSAVKDIFKERDVAKFNTRMQDAISALMKERGLGHIPVTIKVTKIDPELETVISNLVMELQNTADAYLKEEVVGINVLDRDFARAQKGTGNTIDEMTDEPYTVDGHPIEAEVVTTILGGTTARGKPGRPRKVYLNIYRPSSLPDRSGAVIAGTIAHEIGHIKEKKWADSMFVESVLANSPYRPQFDESTGQVVLATGDKIRQAHENIKAEKDYTKKKAFVRQWDTVSCFDLVDVQMPLADDPSKLVTVKQWQYIPDSKGGESIIEAAFDLDEPSDRYMTRSARSFAASGFVTPAEELAEAMRIFRHPQRDQFLKELGTKGHPRYNPAAKKYLQGLLRVIQKHEAMFDKRFRSKPIPKKVLKKAENDVPPQEPTA